MLDTVLGITLGISLVLASNEGDAWWINIIGVILFAIVVLILNLKYKQ